MWKLTSSALPHGSTSTPSVPCDLLSEWDSGCTCVWQLDDFATSGGQGLNGGSGSAFLQPWITNRSWPKSWSSSMRGERGFWSAWTTLRRWEIASEWATETRKRNFTSYTKKRIKMYHLCSKKIQLIDIVWIHLYTCRGYILYKIIHIIYDTYCIQTLEDTNHHYWYLKNNESSKCES